MESASLLCCRVPAAVQRDQTHGAREVDLTWLSAAGAQPGRNERRKSPVQWPPDLLRVARNVIRYDPTERTPEDISTFVAHRQVYGSPADMKVVERYMSREALRKAWRKHQDFTTSFVHALISWYI